MSLQDQRSRRRFLATCAGFTSTIAGCTEQGTTDFWTENNSTSSGTPPHDQEPETTTSETTGEPPCGENTHKLTEWHAAGNPLLADWRFTVTDFEFTPSFTLKDTEQAYEMPEDRQLAIITTVIIHPTAPGEPWDGRFVVELPDGTVNRPQYRFNHPDVADPVEPYDLQEIDWRTTTHPRVENYGETDDVTPAVVQWICVVPRDVSTDPVEIGLEYPPTPDELPSIQASWSASTPNAGTTKTNGSSENPYALGEWHEALGWKFTVADLHLTPSFALDDSEQTYEMPDGKQLAILTTILINITPPSELGNTGGANHWHQNHGEQFVVALPDGETIYPHRGFGHPDIDGMLMEDLRRVSYLDQYGPEGYALGFDSPPGILQWLCVVPRDVSTDSVQVGFTETSSDEPTSIQVHWSPEETC